MNTLIPLEFKNQRIMTTKVLAESYGTEENNIKNNFNNHKERFEEGKHYFLLTGEELKEFKNYVNDIDLVKKQTTHLYLWTEKGALRHAKILDTDEAWEVYEILEETYFKVQEQAKLPNNLKAIAMIHAEVGELIAATSEIENRVENLENTMTIDYSQQLVLSEIAKAMAMNALGGADTAAYKDKPLRARVFSQVWKDYKGYFEVNSYKNTASKDFDKAKEYLKGWKAQGKLLREIENTNKQIEIDNEVIQ